MMDEKQIEELIKLSDMTPEERNRGDNWVVWNQLKSELAPDLAREVQRLRERDKLARALFESLIDLAEMDESEGTLPEDAAELAQKARAWMVNDGI